jgi:hypothetical protein
VIARKWHALQYEFEDVGAELRLADVVAPRTRERTPFNRVFYRNRAGGRPAGDEHRGGADHARLRPLLRLLLVPVGHPAHPAPQGLARALQEGDLLHRRALHQERDQNRRYLELLRELGFDHVYIFNTAPQDSIAAMVGCPVEFMGHGVDAFRFSPYPLVPERSVDLYQYGRRSDVTHAAALEMAQRDGLFYIYDTIFNVPLEDYLAHRNLVAETMKRSRYFFAYRPGENLRRARQDDPLSSRYFEAIGGGAILLGSRPGAKEYDECFGWADATIEIPFERTTCARSSPSSTRSPSGSRPHA